MAGDDPRVLAQQPRHGNAGPRPKRSVTYVLVRGERELFGKERGGYQGAQEFMAAEQKAGREWWLVEGKLLELQPLPVPAPRYKMKPVAHPAT